MKCCIIMSSEMQEFGILNAQFYCNSTVEERNAVLSFRSDKRREHEIKKLKDVLITLKNYDKMIRKVKKDLGLSGAMFTNNSLPYAPKTNLLILYKVLHEIQNNIPDRKRNIRYEEMRINEEVRKLEGLKGGMRNNGF